MAPYIVIAVFAITYPLLMAVFLRFYPSSHQAAAVVSTDDRWKQLHLYTTRESDKFGVIYLLDDNKIDIDGGIARIENHLKFEAIVNPSTH